MTQLNTLTWYHGGPLWKTPPEVRNGKPLRSQSGPGIYLTNSVDNAATYAKGPRRHVQQMTLHPDTRLLPWSCGIKLREALEVSAYLPRVKGAKAFKRLVREYFKDVGLEEDIPLRTLLNLACDTKVFIGKGKPLFAKWLVSLGVDASLESSFGCTWLVVYNPAVILTVGKLESA